MDRCSPIHSVPQIDSRVKSGFRQLFFLSFFLLFSLVQNLTSVAVADTKQFPISTKLGGTTLEQVLRLRGSVAESATLQMTIPTSLFDQNDNILSAVIAAIPNDPILAKLKLNTIGGRGMHDTLLYLDNLSFEEMVEVIRVITNLPPDKVARLNREVEVFSGDLIEIILFGTRSKFIAAKAADAYERWHNELFEIIKEEAPWLAAKHMSHGNLAKKIAEQGGSGHQSHLSLGQFGARFGVDLDEGEVEVVMNRFREIIQTKVREYQARNGGKSPVIKFNPMKTPIQLILPPRSFVMPPTAMASFLINGDDKYQVGEVVRWELPVVGPGQTIDDVKRLIGEGVRVPSRLIDLNARALVGSTDLMDAVHLVETQERWLPDTKSHSVEPLSDFKEKLNPNLKRVLEENLSRTGKENGKEFDVPVLSPTKYPAAVPIKDSAKSVLYVTNQTHPYLDPQKGAKRFEIAEKISPTSSEKRSHALTLYASSLRSDIKNPGDIDTNISSLVHVPNSLKTFDEAKSRAADVFIEEVVGHFVGLARQNIIAITEFRLGSSFSMDFAEGKDQISAREDNLYFSQDELMRLYVGGKYTDPKGRRWTLKELILQKNADAIGKGEGEFMKMKVDYFPYADVNRKPQPALMMRGRIAHGWRVGEEASIRPSGKRDDLSVQFLLGVDWRGSVKSMQGGALKSVPALLRTGVQGDAESHGTGMAMSRAFDFAAAQKGSLFARGYRDFSKSAFGGLSSTDLDTPSTTEPTISTKFVKRLYGLLILGARGGDHLDEVLFFETIDAMKRKGIQVPSDFTLKYLTDNLRSSINQKELALLSSIKRNVNDFREFNERQATFTEQQIYTRIRETESQLRALERLVVSGDLQVDDAFLESLSKFRIKFFKLKRFTNLDEAVERFKDREYFKTFLNFENALSDAEAGVHGNSARPDALQAVTKDFLRTIAAYMPEFLYRFTFARNQELDGKRDLFMMLMGFKTHEERLAKFHELAIDLENLADEEIAQMQREILHGRCVDLLTSQR